MNDFIKRNFLAACVGVLLSIAAPSTGAPTPRPLRSPKLRLDFAADVRPILAARCASCHLNGHISGGLQLDSREQILKGGSSGPAAAPGDSARSLLIHRISDPDNARRMPPTGPRLTEHQIGLLAAWIDGGMPAGRVAAAPVYHLALRKIPLPRVSSESNPIDRLLSVYYRRAGGKRVSQPLDDAGFARRTYLDLIGLLPTPPQLESFLQDPASSRRERLITRLLADDENYAQHWLTFWNDALRNDYSGTGYIDGGRKPITGWLYHALKTNLPYNQFVSQLVNPNPESEGFVKGIVWRGTVNASQTPEMQAAQNISQVFLGINLKCASCHDSFISSWKLRDSYGMAGIFSEQPLELVRCDHPLGVIAPVKFLYPELGSIDASAPRPQRLARLAAILTSPSDGRLARTIVNRVWARLMGRGIVEPTDDMDARAWDPDLLEWLASDFVAHGYDLKHTIRLIASSHAYQQKAVPASDNRLALFHFRGPVVQRMIAEQFLDAVSQLTGVWPDTPAADIQSGGSLKGKWIWNIPEAARAAPGGHIYLRKSVDLPDLPTRAGAVVTCDNGFVLYINGRRVAASDEWQSPVAVDLRPYLVRGRNTFAVDAINWPDPETGKGLQFSSPNAAGFLFVARLRKDSTGSAESSWDFSSDSSWLSSRTHPAGWEQPGFDDSQWQRTFEVGDAATAYGIGSKLAMMLNQALSGAAPHIRAALLKADTLTAALGRPNREQVVTERSTVATTLECLELTNGRMLAGVLHRGAQRWLQAGDPDGAPKVLGTRPLINALFLRALGRKPTWSEGKACGAMLGEHPTTEGVEDLLWSLIMLPEFQLS